jgi:uncharacterized membrane protein
MKPSRYQVVFIACLILGVFYRFYGLGDKLYSHDEAYTSLKSAGYKGNEFVEAVSDGKELTANDISRFLQPAKDRNVPDTIKSIATSEPQLPPLYFVLAHYWMRIAGYSPADMRMLSALLSLLAIPGMYWLGLEVFRSRRIALISVGLISLAPFHILFAQDARPYGLFAVMILFSSSLFFMALRKERYLYWGMYSMSIILGIYTHLFFALTVMVHAVYLLANQGTIKKGAFTRFIFASLFALLAFTPWLLQIFIYFGSLTRGLAWVTQTVPFPLRIKGWTLIFASPFLDINLSISNVVLVLLRLPVLILIGYGIVFLIARTPRRIWSFLLLLVGFYTIPFFLWDFARGGTLTIIGRYFVGLNVATIPIVAYLLADKIGMNNEKNPSKWVLISSLLFLSQIFSNFNIIGSGTWWNKNLSWNRPEIVEILNQSDRPLLIMDGKSGTDIGDLLAFSLMVNKDVRFQMYLEQGVVELSGDYKDIYLYHSNNADFIKSNTGKPFETTEIVGGRLWQVNYLNNP